MKLVDPSDEIQFYKYRLKELYVLFSDGTYKIDLNRLTGVTHMENYLEDLYPVFKIDVCLEPSVYHKIIKEKDTLKVKVYLQKFYRVNNRRKKSVFSKCFCDTFELILDDDDEYLTKDIHEKEFPQGDENQLNAVTIKMEMFLFKKMTIKSNKILINKIFARATVSGAIAYLLSKLGVNNVLMDTVDNRTIYSYIYMPPLTINQELRFIDSYYGIHRTGTVMFFGLTRSYILRFSTSTNAFEPNEIKDICFIVPKEGSAICDSYAQLNKKADKSKKYMIVEPKMFNPRNPDKSQSVIEPEVVEIVSPLDSGVRKEGGGKTNKKVITAKGVNPYYESVYNALKDSESSEIEIFLKDVDYTLLEPNKHYSFLFEDTSLAKKYKGKYFLCKKEASFVKEGEDFTVGVSLTLRKAK